MDYQTLENKLNNSPSLKLIRSDNVVLIVSFLVKEFKIKQKDSFLQSELETELEYYLDDLKEITDNEYPRKAKEYLENWLESKYLQRTLLEGDIPILSLTIETENVIKWFNNLVEKKEFIGTESRFLEIVSLLKEMRDNTTIDPQERIKQLQDEGDRIQNEIKNIQDTGEIETYNPTKLKERFFLLNDLTRELITDFTEVEQNFRKLAKQIQEMNLENKLNKGEILGQVLDGYEILKNSDQGRSFYTFWKYLMAYSQKELKELINYVYDLKELESLPEKYIQLSRLQSDLINRSQSVIKSNNQLAEKLRQVLDEKLRQENRRVGELILEIKQLFLAQIKENVAILEDKWLKIEGECEINLMMERELHPLEEDEPAILTWKNADFLEGNETKLEEFYDQFYIDEEELLKRINSSLKTRLEINLTDLLEIYPITKGVAEVVAYLSIANENEQHLINDIMEKITISSLTPEIELNLTLPQIIFRR